MLFRGSSCIIWRGQEGALIKQYRETLGPIALIIRLGAIVVTAVLLTLTLGLWIDNRLSTSPCGLLVFMLIGIVISVTGVYLVVQQVYDQYGSTKEEK
ncbi:MAG: AtpZ/AtpI family protein [Anaerolineae bacterium]